MYVPLLATSTRGYLITNFSQSHWRLLSLAFPLIIANITTPILGLVDTAILGRMDEVHYFAGAAIGSLIVTQLYWVCGFLRMSITGISAQTKNKTSLMQLEVLVKGVALSFLLALIVLLIQPFVLKAGLYFANASVEVTASTREYFTTRIFGAPAALINLAMIGWLVGQQKTKMVLILQIIINVTNIAASLLFVYVFEWGVAGVAAATVLAEYLMLGCALWLVYKSYSGQSKLKVLKAWLHLSSMKSLLSLNGHMFIRNLALQFTLAFITLKGAQFGAEAAAVNAIIMQFFTLIALGLDGIANGVEALVGEQKGNQNGSAMHEQVKTGLVWSSLIAVLYTLVFYYLDSPIVNLLTHHQTIIDAVADYSVVIVMLPLIAHWCFLMDGVFVGLSKGRAMRDSMLLSACLGFLPTWWLFQSMGNMSLWIAMLVFLGSRGLIQGIYYMHWLRKGPQALVE